MAQNFQADCKIAMETNEAAGFLDICVLSPTPRLLWA